MSTMTAEKTRIQIASFPHVESARTLITLCTYNERQNLQEMIPDLQSRVPHADILVIDDNSPDGTGRYATELSLRDDRVKVILRPGKLGLGTATVAGLKFAIDNNYDYVINLDCDFSHDPRHVTELLALADTADVVIGSRYVAGGSVKGWSFQRRMMSKLINIYSRFCLGLKTRDSSGSYRCYRVSKLCEIDWSKVRSRGYSFQEEVLYRCRKVGCKLVETPITFADRRYGSSKINSREAIMAVWVLFRLYIDDWMGTPVRLAGSTEPTSTKPAARPGS